MKLSVPGTWRWRLLYVVVYIIVLSRSNPKSRMIWIAIDRNLTALEKMKLQNHNMVYFINMNPMNRFWANKNLWYGRKGCRFSSNFDGLICQQPLTKKGLIVMFLRYYMVCMLPCDDIWPLSIFYSITFSYCFRLYVVV